MFLPSAAIIAVYGLNEIIKKNKFKNIFLIFLIIISLFQLFTNLLIEKTEDPMENYYSFFKEKNITGEVWIHNPKISYHTEKNLKLLYYPVFNEKKIDSVIKYFKKINQKSNMFFLTPVKKAHPAKKKILIVKEKDKNLLSY
ncbi:hypothetical protein GF327_06160 [Candidatus Woesearchaeota archaeon]|nr:hypothetical protein [Candidatus Woesearchaeota archaeon]